MKAEQTRWQFQRFLRPAVACRVSSTPGHWFHRAVRLRQQVCALLQPAERPDPASFQAAPLVLRDSCPQLSCDEKAGAKGKGPEGVAQGEAEAKMAAWLAGMYKKVQNKPAAPPPPGPARAGSTAGSCIAASDAAAPRRQVCRVALRLAGGARPGPQGLGLRACMGLAQREAEARPNPTPPFPTALPTAPLAAASTSPPAPAPAPVRRRRATGLRLALMRG
jgi:hypothetical protein